MTISTINKMNQLDLSLPPLLQRQRVGHDLAWEHLTCLFETNKFHSAWIFSGPQGIGKATLAYQLARYILANSPPNKANSDFYNGLIDQRAHPNLLIIERQLDEDGVLANEIKMDDVRRIREFTQQSPTFPGWRLILIDGMEYLNRNAANAVLKVLEEPPHQTAFFCICHQLKNLLPTIRSRCRLLPLHPLTKDDRAQLGNQWSTISPLEQELSEGSLGRLHSFKVQQGDKSLNSLFQILIKLIQEALQGRISEVIAFSATLKKHDPIVPLILELLTWTIRRIILLSAGLPSTLPEDQELQRIANSRPLMLGKDGKHWLTVQEKLEAFLTLSKGAHLDQGHLLEACFIILNQPNYFQEIG